MPACSGGWGWSALLTLFPASWSHRALTHRLLPHPKGSSNQPPANEAGKLGPQVFFPGVGEVDDSHATLFQSTRQDAAGTGPHGKALRDSLLSRGQRRKTITTQKGDTRITSGVSADPSQAGHSSHTQSRGGRSPAGKDGAPTRCRGGADRRHRAGREMAGMAASVANGKPRRSAGKPSEPRRKFYKVPRYKHRSSQSESRTTQARGRTSQRMHRPSAGRGPYHGQGQRPPTYQNEQSAATGPPPTPRPRSRSVSQETSTQEVLGGGHLSLQGGAGSGGETDGKPGGAGAAWTQELKTPCQGRGYVIGQ